VFEWIHHQTIILSIPMPGESPLKYILYYGPADFHHRWAGKTAFHEIHVQTLKCYAIATLMPLWLNILSNS